jgi:ABC-2 type transport system ATP-binding protein
MGEICEVAAENGNREGRFLSGRGMTMPAASVTRASYQFGARRNLWRLRYVIRMKPRLQSPPHPYMSDLAIDIRNVVKRYEEHVAVRDLSLQVPRGTVYGLLGPNGAGKTTTIRMILDIILPDSGSISLFGRPNTDISVLDQVGYLPEERGLYKKMQVRRVLVFLAELKGLDAATANKRIDEWLERFGLSGGDKNWGEAKVDELSRGMQQKVQFIATMLHDPELVILDEPFSGLDPINAQALKDAVLELRRRGKTVIFSTHIMDNAEKMCDSVCIIARGEKVLDGGVAEVKAAAGARNIALSLTGGAQNGVGAVLRDTQLISKVDDNNHYFELELAPNADAQVLLRRLVDAGASIQRFEMMQPSLHQIFLQRVGANGIEAGMSGHG